MTDADGRSVHLELDASAARELVDNGLAEYYIAGDRDIGADLVQVAINAGGGVMAVVVITLTKATAKAVAKAVKRHRQDEHPPAVVTGDATVVSLDDEGVALLQAVNEQPAVDEE